MAVRSPLTMARTLPSGLTLTDTSGMIVEVFMGTNRKPGDAMKRFPLQRLVACLLATAVTLASVVPVTDACTSTASQSMPRACCCRGKCGRQCGCCSRRSEARRSCGCNASPHDPAAPQQEERVTVRLERRSMVAVPPVVSDADLPICHGERFVSDASPRLPPRPRLQALLCCWLI